MVFYVFEISVVFGLHCEFPVNPDVLSAEIVGENQNDIGFVGSLGRLCSAVRFRGGLI